MTSNEHATSVVVLSIATAAKSLGVCARTVKREIDYGRLKAFKIGRQWRIRLTEIHAYATRREHEYARPSAD